MIIVQEALGSNPGFVYLEDANLVPVDKLAKALTIAEITVQVDEPLVTLGELTPEVWPHYTLLTRHIWSHEVLTMCSGDATSTYRPFIYY